LKILIGQHSFDFEIFGRYKVNIIKTIKKLSVVFLAEFLFARICYYIGESQGLSLTLKFELFSIISFFLGKISTKLKII
jgi:hypothetical protein